MKTARRHIALILVVAAVVAGCSRSAAPGDALEDSPPVAVVADRVISLEEYRRTYVDYLLETGLPDDPARREAFLRRIVNVRLIAQRERSAGIEQSAAYRERARLVSSRLLVDSFVEREIFADIEITEDDLRDMFVRANTEMTVRHLYARTQKEAERLLGRLRTGETFDTLAEEVFDDPRLAASGGLVGPFGFDEMDPAFEEAAFNLPMGEISEPVRTANGYSILRVEDRTAKPLLTQTEFAEKRDRLEAQVAFRKKARARAEFLAGMLTELDPVFEARTLEALAAQVLTGRPAEGESLTDDAVLVRLDGTRDEWTVGEFRAAAELTGEEQIARIRTVRDLTTFVEGLIAREEMIRRARAAGLEESPKYLTAFRSEMDRWVYDRAYTDLVEAIEVPSDTVHSYWLSFRDELMTEPMVDIREIVVTEPEARARVAAELQTTKFEDVARRHSVRTDDRGERGGILRLNRDQLGLFADRVFEAEGGEVIGPHDVGETTVWLQIVDHVSARPMTLDEAAPRIERMIRWSERQDVLRATADEIRAEVNVRVWPERVLEMALAPGATTSTVRPTAADTSPFQNNASPKPRDIGS